MTNTVELVSPIKGIRLKIFLENDEGRTLPGCREVRPYESYAACETSTGVSEVTVGFCQMASSTT